MPHRLPLSSSNPLADRLESLRALIPEAFTEGKIDFDRLKGALGAIVETDRERYGLSWAGKSDAIRAVQSQSVGTLKPAPEESVAFDTTGNVIIEGDNLEVLKLLQRSYHAKVKMIYIDPPYNTGNEFIYPDNFKEGLADYLRYSGQVTEEGFRSSTNSETDGRFHSKWLDMMYPRLFLARNLLREDGVIFISIDDHEVHNLRLLINEIFGEENFVASVIWQKVFSPKNTARHFSEDHEYVVAYARNEQAWTPELLPRTDEMEARYSNPDDDPRGPWSSSDLCARNFYGAGTYPVKCPSGRVISGPPTGTYWRVSKPKFQELDADDRIHWGPNGNNMPRLKRYLSDVKAGLVPQTLWKYQDVGHTQEAKKALLSTVSFTSSDDVFDTPKPPRLIERMLRLATKSTGCDLIFDFFAGSGTTAQAVLELNKEDGGNRQFILVQLPEKTTNPQFPTIAEITKERVRRVIDRMNKAPQIKASPPLEGTPAMDMGETEEPEGDPAPAPGGPPGFRVFKLAASCFRIWDGADSAQGEGGLAAQLYGMAENLQPDSRPEEVLFEVLLKAGLPLSAQPESLTVAGQTVYRVGELIVCLEPSITQETLRGIAALRPQRVICLDHSFHGSDDLLTNAELEMKGQEIEFQTI